MSDFTDFVTGFAHEAGKNRETQREFGSKRRLMLEQLQMKDYFEQAELERERERNADFAKSMMESYAAFQKKRGDAQKTQDFFNPSVDTMEGLRARETQLQGEIDFFNQMLTKRPGQANQINAQITNLKDKLKDARQDRQFYDRSKRERLNKAYEFVMNSFSKGLESGTIRARDIDLNQLFSSGGNGSSVNDFLMNAAEVLSRGASKKDYENLVKDAKKAKGVKYTDLDPNDPESFNILNKRIEDQLAIESSKVTSPQMVQKISSAKELELEIDELINMLDDDVNRGFLKKSGTLAVLPDIATMGIGLFDKATGMRAQEFKLKRFSIAERILRLRSGAQINQKEYQRFLTLLPGVFRMDGVDLKQLNSFKREFNHIQKLIEGGRELDPDELRPTGLKEGMALVGAVNEDTGMIEERPIDLRLLDEAASIEGVYVLYDPRSKGGAK